MDDQNRTRILETIRRNRPPETPLPEIPKFAEGTSLRDRFVAKVWQAGGEVLEVPYDALEAVLRPLLPARWASTVPGLEGPLQLNTVDDPHVLADLEALVCPARLGVAENGAVWLDEAALIHRAAAFLVEHLIVVLDSSHIVVDLHEAYALLTSMWEGFGLWVAGPSKTADIEQTLVRGIHGPQRFTVVMLQRRSSRKSYR
ncbi:MAG: LUD domain-containing protein [Rhodothermus sp.]|nr:LUD domain-containing protein [Rhodothermus sp.]